MTTSKRSSSKEVTDSRGTQLEELVQRSKTRLTNSVVKGNQPKKQADLSITDEYAKLKQMVKQRGLLERQLGYYVFKGLSTLAMLAVSLAFLVLVDVFWLQLINAMFLGFVFAQIGYVGHDAGHRQIFHSVRNNEIISLAICFLLAFERTWWLDKHNRHHSNPNHTALDPDADLPVIAFTKEQALKKKGFYRFIVTHQVFFFYPMLCLEGLGLRLAGIQYALANKIKYPLAEPMLMLGHGVAYFGLLFLFLSFWHVLLFFLVHQLVFGLIVGSAFAPNHKGMLMLGEDGSDDLDFLRRQVLTSRNVRGNVLTDFWYGGLNYQIEHHLFPNMPRNKLRETQKVVKEFCMGHSIPYHETGLIQSQKEILQALYLESAPLRSNTT